jgi:hypothetical protein
VVYAINFLNEVGWDMRLLSVQHDVNIGVKPKDMMSLDTLSAVWIKHQEQKEKT